MSDKTAILEKFNNDKLIDVVKNYKQYGYDDAIRNTALAILRERGIDKSFLEMTGNLHNSSYEFAKGIYQSYKRNSKIAYMLYVLSVVMFIVEIAHMHFDAFMVVFFLLRVICFIGFAVFFLLSVINQTQFYKSIKKDQGAGDIFLYFILAFPLYIIMYFVYKNQMAEEMHLIK